MINLLFEIGDLRLENAQWLELWVIDHWGTEISADIEKVVLNAD